MSVGEGGAVLSDNELINKIKSVINFNFSSIDTSSYWTMNGKMSKFHAAIGRPALNKLPSVIFGGQKVAFIWMDELYYLDKFIGYPNWQLFPILIKKLWPTEFYQTFLKSIGLKRDHIAIQQ